VLELFDQPQSRSGVMQEALH